MGENPEQRCTGHESAVFSFWRDSSSPLLPLKDSTKELKSKKPWVFFEKARGAFSQEDFLGD